MCQLHCCGTLRNYMERDWWSHHRLGDVGSRVSAAASRSLDVWKMDEMANIRAIMISEQWYAYGRRNGNSIICIVRENALWDIQGSQKKYTVIGYILMNNNDITFKFSVDKLLMICNIKFHPRAELLLFRVYLRISI